jgi:hypothetical protein
MTHFPDILVYGNDSYIKRIDPSANANAPTTVIFSKDKKHVRSDRVFVYVVV